VLELAHMHGNIPVFVAGGIRTHDDILYALSRGAAGVQIGTPFVVTYESGASDHFKQTLINSKNEDVMLGDQSWGSPAGYPFRYLRGSPLVYEKSEGNYFCICSGLFSSTNTEIAMKEGDCPERYVRPLCGACLAQGNVIYKGLYTSGTEINTITRIRHAADIIKELAG
jgi:nitronate monooxygenase